MSDNLNSKLNGERLYSSFIYNPNNKIVQSSGNTIAVFGKWGCGKSTSKEEFINKCKESCKKNRDFKKIITVDYKALQFEEASQITSDLYYQIADSIKQHKEKTHLLLQFKRWFFVINKFKATAKLKKESINHNMGVSYLVGAVIGFIIIKLLLPTLQSFVSDSVGLLFIRLLIDPIYWVIALSIIAFYNRDLILSIFAGILPYRSHIQELESALKGFYYYYNNWDLVICIDEIDRLNSSTVKLLLDEICNIKEILREIKKDYLSGRDYNKIKIFVFYDNDILHNLLLKAEIDHPSIYLQKFFDKRISLGMPYFYNGLVLFYFKLLKKIEKIYLMPSSNVLQLIANNSISFRMVDHFCRAFYEMFYDKEIYKHFFEDEHNFKKIEIDLLILAFSLQHWFEIGKLSDVDLINSKITQNECKNYIDQCVEILLQVYYFPKESAEDGKDKLSQMVTKLSNYKKCGSQLAHYIYRQEEKKKKQDSSNYADHIEKEIAEYYDTIMAEVNKHLVVMQDIENSWHQYPAPRDDIAMFLALMKDELEKISIQKHKTLKVLDNNILSSIQEVVNFKYLFFVCENHRKWRAGNNHHSEPIDCFTFNKNLGDEYGETLYSSSNKICDIKLDFQLLDLNNFRDYERFLKSRNFTTIMMKRYFQQNIEMIQMFLTIEFDPHNKNSSYIEDTDNKLTRNEDEINKISSISNIQDFIYHNNANRSSVDKIEERYIKKTWLNSTVVYALCNMLPQILYIANNASLCITQEEEVKIYKVLKDVLCKDFHFASFDYTEHDWQKTTKNLPAINTIYLYPALIFLKAIYRKEELIKPHEVIKLNFRYAPNDTGKEYQKNFPIDLNRSIEDIIRLTAINHIQKSLVESILRSMMIYTLVFSKENSIEAQYDPFGIVQNIFKHFNYNADKIIDEFFPKKDTNSFIIASAIIDKIKAICRAITV